MQADGESGSEPSSELHTSDRSGAEPFLDEVAVHICGAVAELCDELTATRPLLDGPHPRLAVGAALSAVLRFLGRVDPHDPGDRHRPIGTLLAALSDLEAGQRPELLKPDAEPLRARSYVPLDQLMIRGHAVACADLLVSHAGRTRPQADAEVGRALNAIGFPTGRLDTQVARAVGNWRNRVNRSGGEAETRLAYLATMQSCEHLPPPIDAAAKGRLAAELINMLRQEVKARGFQKEREV